MVQNFDRISIIGAGTLGGTIAYSLMISNMAKEILLVDMSHKILQGQVLDLTEANTQPNVTIRAGTFKEAGQSNLLILTADTLQTTSRSSWLIQSRDLLLSIAASISPVQSEIMILITSEPVDLYVHSLHRYFPHVNPNRIFGIGTTLASRRFESWLQNAMPHQTISDAYCIGSRQMPVVCWSQAKINRVPVSNLPLLGAQRGSLERIVSDQHTRWICEKKGSACFGVAAHVTQLVLELSLEPSDRASLRRESVTSRSNSSGVLMMDPQKVWVLSVYVPEYDGCLSWPVKVGSGGIDKLLDITLTLEEQAKVAAVVSFNYQEFQTSCRQSL